jgi:hypothetical protein
MYSTASHNQRWFLAIPYLAGAYQRILVPHPSPTTPRKSINQLCIVYVEGRGGMHESQESHVTVNYCFLKMGRVRTGAGEGTDKL